MAKLFPILVVLFILSGINGVIGSYILRAHMKKWFNFTYRHFAEPLVEVTMKLRKEALQCKKNDKRAYKRHIRLFRYMIFSFIFSPITFFILIGILGIVNR